MDDRMVAANTQADQRENLLQWAFVLALVGGIVIVAGAVGSFLLFLLVAVLGFRLPMPMMMGGYGWFVGFALLATAWGLVAGVLSLIAAWQLRMRRGNVLSWGILLVVAGVASLPVAGGFGLGAFAVLAAGVLAVIAGEPRADAAGAARGGPP